MKSGIALLLLIQVGCYDQNAQQSAIVREVEAAGAGDLRTYTAPGLRQWFASRPELALRIASECAPLAKGAQANWIVTAEGTTCQAASGAALWVHQTFTPDAKAYE